MEIKYESNILSKQGDLTIGIKFVLFFADHISDTALEFIRIGCNSMLKHQLIFDIFQSLFGIFVKENFAGPSYHFQSIDKKLHLENLLTKQVIPKYEPYSISKEQFVKLGLGDFLPLIDQISSVSEYEIYHTQANQEYLQNYLQCCGEPFKRVIPLKHIFVVCKEILKLIHDKSPYYQLWWARINYMHNYFLDNPVQELKEQIFQAYQEFIDNSALNNQELAKHYTELSYMYNFYYRYQEAENCLLKAQSLLRVRFELTGKLGKRTKFQEEKFSQLIAEIIDEESVQQECINQNYLVKQLPNVQDVLQQYAPTEVKLEEESILYEKPIVEGDVKHDFLTLEEQIVLLGLIHHYKRTLASDEILQQQIQAYLNLMLDKPHSWIVYSQGLLLRSLNEFNHLKKMERALGQLQVLVDQFNEQQPDIDSRLVNLFFTSYPDYYNLSGIMAELWMKVGMMQSGYEIFARLEMWEECVECLVASGDTTRALKEIDNITNKGFGTIKMKCIQGEIKQDPKILKQAWKDSKKRFARAQRSLGEYYFFREKNYEKSIKSYSKAVKINAYHQKSWYIMGCAQMRLNRLEDAIKSLGEAVRINESDGEIWGNISSCLLSLKKYNEAQSALEQGVKYASTDWRLWSNLMAISLRNKKFVRFYSCIEKLIQLDHRELIDEQIVAKITQTFAYQTEIVDKNNLIQSNINKKRILKLYEHLAKEIGQRYYVWEGLARYTEILIAYDQKVSELENNQIIEIQPYYNDIAQYRLKSCQMLQVLNWERDMSICETLIKQLQSLNKDVMKLKDTDTIKTISVYISQQKSRLESLLERKVDL